MALAWAAVFYIAPAHADLKERFASELQNPSGAVSSELHNAASRFHLVFVAGLGSDFGKDRWFVPHARSAMNDIGFSGVSRLFPPSVNSVQLNAKQLAVQLREISTRVGRPLVIFAHSKGAVESLLAATRDTDLVGANAPVARMIFIQGAFGGSPLADAAAGAFDTIIKSLQPFIGSSFGQDADAYIDSVSKGIRSLGRKAMHRLMPRRIADLREHVSVEQFADISSRIDFIRGMQKVDFSHLNRQGLGEQTQMSFRMIPTAIYASRFGANDGVVLVDDQVPPGIGVDLGVLNGDHADFVNPSSNASEAFQTAFVRAAVEESLLSSGSVDSPKPEIGRPE